MREDILVKMPRGEGVSADAIGEKVESKLYYTHEGWEVKSEKYS